MRVFRLIILLAIALAATPLDPAAAQAPVKIRAGWVSTPASLIPLLFLKPGVTRHHGKSYIFEPMYFASSTLQITAISQGELDLAAFGYTSFPLAIANAGLSDLRIVADEIQDGAPGYYSTPYFVRKDSGIDKISDMKGKVAVTNGLGSGVDIVMRAALRRHGLEVQRDYTMIEAPFPTHKEMLREHKGDLVVGVLPFSYDREFNEFAKPLFTTGSSLGRIALSFWAVRQPFLEGNGSHLFDLLKNYPIFLPGSYDANTNDRPSGMLARSLNRPPARFADWLFTRKDFYRDLDGKPDLSFVKQSIDRCRRWAS